MISHLQALSYLNGPGKFVRERRYRTKLGSYGYQYDSLVALQNSTHSTEDVGLYAIGAGVEYL